MELRHRIRVRAILALATTAQILTIVFGVSILAHSAPTDAAQTVPYKINFQGRLSDSSGNILSDGLYNVKFRLWDNLTVGSNVWQADRVRGASDRRIQVTNGLFNIQFGDTTLGDPALSPTLFSNGTYPLYLEVELPTPATATCATNGCAVFTEGAMTPRQALASAPYAFSADTLDGLDSAAFGQLAAANTFTGANVFQPSSGVAITVRPPAATHSLDVKDSAGTTQAYFDASGILNVAQTIQATAGTVDLGTSGSTFRTGYFGTSVQTPALNATASGGTVTTNLGTLQRVSSGTTTIDLKDAGTTTLAVTNSGGGVAGISATGGLTIGSGKVITVGATAGTAASCSSGQVLDAVTILGGVVTGGTCVAAGGGEKLGGTWTSQQATTTTNQQTTVQFTGTANSAPSFNNATHVLTLPSNASKLVISSKGGGGGGGGTGTAAVANKMAVGGGEGGYSQYTLAGSLASNYYFKVGGGGGGGATTPTAGTGGSSTCFGTGSSDACTTPLTNATGGTGGGSSNVVCALVTTVAGGSGIGDLVNPGAPSMQNACTTATGVTLYSSGGGGAGGGRQLIAALAANGTANSGTAASGGGGGGSWTASGNGGNGGAGGSGFLTIDVYTAVTGTGSSATLQTAYDNSSDPEIVLSGSGLSVRDSSGGIGGNLLEVEDTTGSTNYLAVTTAGVSTSGTYTGSTTNTINGLSINAGALTGATSNTINGLSISSGAISGSTGYVQGSGTFSQTYSSAAASTAHAISITNTNAGAGVTMQGIGLTPTNATPGSLTNTLNVINFAAGSGTSATAVTNGINFASSTGYTNFINSPSLKVNNFGDDTTAFTQLDGTTTTNGAGTASTALILTSAANFDIGNYVQVSDTNCGGAGVNVCYAKITNKVTNTLTITPALTWTTGKGVLEFHVPEIGGTDLTQTLANRYGRGYFISGVATGNGTTYYNEDSVDSNLSTFNLLNSNVTTLNIGGAATNLAIGSGGTTVSIPGSLSVTGNISAPATGTSGYLSRSGTTLSPVNANDNLNLGTGTITSGNVNGQTIGNSASFVTSVTAPTINGSTALQVGGANINTGGGSPTLSNVDYLDSAQTISATKTFSKSGGQAAIFSGTAASAGAIIQFGSVAALSLGSANGTYLGSNPAAFTGDFINFQVNNAVKLKVDNTGAATLAAGLTIGSGTAITVGAAAGQSSTVSCSAGQAVTTATFTGGVLTTAPGCAAISSSGASTTLNNLGTTSINADLLPSANNTRSIGSAALVWQNVFTGNLDAGSTTTALTVGTAATTTAITIGRAGVPVSLPGGLTTSNGTINTGNGSITTTGAIGGGAITGTSLSAGSGTISTTGGITGATLGLSANGAAAAPVLNFTGAPLGGIAAAATTSMVQLGGAIAAGNQAANGGTYLGLNLPAAGAGSAADFLNFQKNNTLEFKVDNSGNGTLGGGLTVGTGAVAAFSSAGLFQNAAVDSTLTYSNLQKVGTISTGTWQGTGIGVLYGGTGQTTYTDGQLLIGNTTGNTLTKATLTGTANRLSITNGSGSITLNVDTTQFPSAGGANTILKSSGANAASWVANTQTNICSDCATTSLSNVASTSIGAALTASANNTQNLGAAATVWQNVFTGNLDAGTTTTALTVGTAATTTAVTIGRAAVAVSIPGGITTSNGAINAGNGAITTTGTITGNLFSGSGASLTSLNPTNLAQGSGAVTLQSANATALTLNSGTSGAVNVGTQGTGKTIQIGQNTAAVTDVINIGNSAFAGSVDTITIGNQLTTSTTAIQGGTGASGISLTPGSNGGILATTTGTGVIELDSASSIIAQTTTNSTSAFQVQNAAGAAIFNVDTTDTQLITTNPGFETNPLTGWNNLSGGSVARDTTQQYVGAASGKVTAGTTAGGGISANYSLTNAQQYTLSFYAKLDAASAAFTTLQAGYSNTGLVGGETDCTLNSGTVIAAGWNRYTCTFVAGAASGTPYIYIEHSDTTSQVFYVDAVQLETGSFATPYGAGKIALNANINSPVNFQQSANSSTAFQITNTNGNNILNVDTLNSNLSNQANNPSFETGTTGWAAKTGCTLTQDATTSYNGTSSAKCVNAATASAGMNMTGISPVMVNGTTYTMSMYVKASANMSTLEIGRADNGVADTACLTGQTVTSLGWKRFTCTFTAGAQSGTPYIYVKQTDATVRTIWVDAVLFETDTNASTNYRDGRISLGNATISSPAVFQTNTNSTTAFQIQNAAGIQVFNVDTASDTGLVANSGFEVNSSGWAINAGASNLVRDTSKTYVGIASGKVTTAVTAGSGMRYTFPTQLPAAFYTISAYVQTSAADATFNIGYNNGADTNCAAISPTASATVPSTTGWTRFVCTTATSAVLNSIYITSGTTAVTLNVDGVRVEAGSVATAFGNSSISFNGVFTSPVAIRSPNDTTTEFQVQTAASVNLLSVDSLNKIVSVGSGVTDATQISLQLDSYNTFADTANTCSATANNGSLYYNSSTNVVRACIKDPINNAGNWEDMPSTAGLGAILFGVVPDSGLSANQGDWAAIGGATVGPCKPSWASATTISVAPCNAYSGGRKVSVTAATVVTMPATTAGQFVHVCFNASGALVASAAGTEIANFPAFSANNPLLCIADVSASGVNTIGKIYDLRTFTTTQKEFVTNQTTLAGLGQTVSTMAATNSVIGVPTTTNTSILRGVVVAQAAATSTSAVTSIIATRGPQWVKFAPAAGTINAFLQPITGGTAGYLNSSATAGTIVYGNLGLQLRLSDNATCTTSANCQMSVPTDINLR